MCLFENGSGELWVQGGPGLALEELEAVKKWVWGECMGLGGTLGVWVKM